MAKGKNSEYVLNFLPKHLEKMIAYTEENVTTRMSLLQEKLQPLKEAEEYYNNLKREYDDIESKLNEDKSFLQALTGLRENKSDYKSIRVLRTTSSLSKPVVERSNFAWQDAAVKVLTKAEKYLTPLTLWENVVKEFPEVRKKFVTKTKESQLKHTFIHNMTRVCERTLEKGEGILVSYNERIGLFEWTDDDMVPEPKYVKHFMGHQKA